MGRVLYACMHSNQNERNTEKSLAFTIVTGVYIFIELLNVFFVNKSSISAEIPSIVNLCIGKKY